MEESAQTSNWYWWDNLHLSVGHGVRTDADIHMSTESGGRHVNCDRHRGVRTRFSKVLDRDHNLV